MAAKEKKVSLIKIEAEKEFFLKTLKKKQENSTD